MNHPATCHLSRSRIGAVLRFAALMLLPVFVTLVHAQTENGSLAGKVTDASSQTALSGAQLRIGGTNIETATDREGHFWFSSLPAGTHTVSVSYLGLDAKDFPITIIAGEPATLDAKLGGDVIQLEAFTVSGQREGQARALNEQRASDNLKSIVSSDALGRFPDQNAAESLQRITGVSLERDQGEGRFVVIRGIDPDLNNTQLNGISIPASEEDTRKVNLDVIPSDLLESVEVTKAVTPDMDGDAIGGSINLKTMTAFSQQGRVLRGSAEGQYSDVSGEWGHRLSFTYGDVFNDGKLGVVLSLSDQKRRFGSDNYETGDPWESEGGFDVPGGDNEWREYVIRRARQGASLSLDFRPNADTSFFIRGVANHYSDYEYRYATALGGDPEDTMAVNDNMGTVSDGSVAVSLKDREEDNNIWTVSAGGEHRRGRMTIDYVASFAHAELLDPSRFEPEFEGPDTEFSYDYSNESRPRFSGPFSSIAASEFELDELVIEHSENVEEEVAFAANIKIDTQFGANPGFWKFGFKHREKEKDVDINADIYGDDSDGALTLANVARTSPKSITANFPSVDGPAMRAYFDNNPGQFEYEDDDSLIESTLADFLTNEDVTAGYLMASVTLDRLTLIGGARLEHTAFKTKGWEITDEDPDTLRQISASRKYDDILPNLHARFDFSPRMVGRASWTQTLARPKFPDSAFTRQIDDDGNYFQGNPNLSPYRSNNFDASVEYYPQSLGVISAGFFHKKIDDFIFRQVLSGASPEGTDLSIPLNGRSADITGLELTWQQQFTRLPSPFDGLGLYANLTLTESEADLGDARPDERLPFLKQSDRIANYAVSYEKYGFFLRVAANYRSAYLDEIGEAPEEDRLVRERWQVDVSTNYRISDRYTIYAEALNVTNEPFLADWGVSNRIMQAEFYYWSANVGVKFNF